MEEETAAKAAPVTRLRRRLSVETEETKLPSASAPSTPTKKRATRLAAKPQLELIDEHAVTESPKRVTRKSISRDIAEPEERSVTPARRSTRTKSNTSLVSEADDKPATPARRSTRIKSNTSIVSETVQSVESPRAKRATTRRASQVGSDTEAPVTPARTRRTRKASTSSIDKDEPPSITETAVTPGRTRRTRKGSTSSIDAPAEAAQAEKPSLITEVIAEEPEAKLRKSTSNDTSIANDNQQDDSPTRKSPRLQAKKSRKSKSDEANETPKQSQEIQEDNLKLSTEQIHKKDETEANPKHDISIASANLIKDLDTKLKKKISNKNKSLSDVEYTTDSKKRDRTKSWTTLCSSPQVESNFYSDNESTKKKLKKHGKIFNDKRLSSSGDTGNGDGPEKTDSNRIEEKDQNLNSSKKSRKSMNRSANLENSIFEDTKEVDISNESNKENLLGVAPPVKEISAEQLLFENEPSAVVKSMVFIEDSDSNNDNLQTQGKQTNNEDQCVPVVLHKSDHEVSSSENTKEQINIFAINNKDNVGATDYDVEPMDIDETIPENVSFEEFTEENKKTRKSSQSTLLDTEGASLNKSNRKSSKAETNENVENQNSSNVHESVSSTQSKKDKKSFETEDANLNKSKRKSLKAEINENGENEDNSNLDESVLSSKSKKDKKPRKSSQSLQFNDRDGKSSTAEENTDIPEGDQNISAKKDKKSRKSSLSAAITDPTEEDDTKQETENEEQNISINESKRSRKSSLKLQESDSSISTKSKRKSILSSSYSEDKNDITVDANNEDAANESTQQKSRKSSLSIAQNNDENNKVNNKSKRKSSLSTTMDHEKTGNESKSTLVLSQIKDVSAAENSITKSSRNTSELSKSINVDKANEDALVNKNLVLNYLTSTPVQQKKIDKLTMPMNTSVITPTVESKNVSKFSKTSPKKNVSIVSKSSNDNSSEEESDESDEESSQEKSNLFDDQAEDAGEEYESGDSQDEDERRYERENEIPEEGETLTSDEESLGDSDYEKDSFIVSSDEDDNELLSGSGDDLDMSDNELTLSAKSKKKYNERKIKEQKKSSREMFEARHGQKNKSEQKSETKTRNRLDSSLLKSDEDILPPKKNKRMRLESTMDSSQTQTDTEDVKSKKDLTIASDKEEIGYKKKKSKRLSESVCNESAINEKEITICNQSSTEREDPLLQVKTEPKTPVRDLDISRIHVTDDVEQVQVDENLSIMKPNETSDPLQSTVLQEQNDSDDDDSISENEEISNNYDSILKDLNKDHKKQIKSQNISLNFDKKVKKTKEPIVEDLNLTTTKISKKDTSLQAKEKSVKRVFKKLAESDESSDSINMQLLFSDDSNGSKESEDAQDKIIPLKKSDAKMDIRKSLDVKQTDDSLNTSSKKKNKKTTTTDDANEDEGSFNFFIDTKGELPDATNESDSNDAPVEMLYVSNKKKNNSVLKTPTSERKKKMSQSEDLVADTENEAPASGKKKNNSILKTPTSEKKKKLSHSEDLVADTENKTPASDKKKKLVSESPNITKQTSEKKKKLSISQDYEEVALPKTPGSDKKAKKVSESEVVTKVAEEHVVTKETASNAKKRKRKSSANNTIDDIKPTGAKVAETAQKLNDSVIGNKKKKVKLAASIDHIEENIETSVTENPVSEQTDTKKSKKNKSPSVESVSEPPKRKSKKRKERDEEQPETISKVFKENSFDKVCHVPRLPAGIIEQLDEMPKNGGADTRKAKKVVSTSNFVVEETLKRKNKPSDFLEETVYLNDDESDAVPKKSNLKKPKVLPFLPTVSTSYSGFTTNFQVNVISQKMEFVARNNDVPNFKNDYLNNKRIKKLRTYDLYKKQRNTKLSKY